MPSFVSWVHLLPALLAVLRWLEEESERGDTEYLVSSRARDLVEQIGPDLVVAGLAPPPVRSLPGTSYLPAFVQMIEALLKTIRRDPGACFVLGRDAQRVQAGDVV